MYRIRFQQGDQHYDIYAKHVYASDIHGFVTIEDMVFGERTKLVVDPSEEKLRSEFEGVRRALVPYYSVLRIDEVEKPGPAKITEAGKVTHLPTPLLPKRQPDTD